MRHKWDQRTETASHRIIRSCATGIHTTAISRRRTLFKLKGCHAYSQYCVTNQAFQVHYHVHVSLVCQTRTSIFDQGPFCEVNTRKWIHFRGSRKNKPYPSPRGIQRVTVNINIVVKGNTQTAWGRNAAQINGEGDSSSPVMFFAFESFLAVINFSSPGAFSSYSTCGLLLFASSSKIITFHPLNISFGSFAPILCSHYIDRS